MRRPVKPFVTEYKGPSRRQAQPAGQVQRQPIEEFSFSSPPVEMPAPRGGDGFFRGEDAYEAAMRAADALFSIPTAKTLSPVADDAFDLGHSDQPSYDQAETVPGGGRILRVIDEAPALDLAELEAERAPKRRGRKPGSKNKPKPPILTIVPRAESYVVTPLFTRDEDEDDDESVDVGVAISQRPVSLGYVSRGDERFAWVRTKLQPGERWKRRLPKICW